MAEIPETKVRFNKDLMKEVVRTCDYTNHSAKALIEECVRAFLEQINTEDTVVPVPALVVLVRKKMGRQTQTLKEAVRELVREELYEKEHARPIFRSNERRGMSLPKHAGAKA
jgi:hypothetical protein